MIVLHSVPTIEQEDINEVLRVLNTGSLEDGNVVNELESDFSEYYGRKYAVATNNGFSAIHLALIGLNVTKGNEVILPSYSCPALLNPILIQQANPILADTEVNSFNISISDVKHKITDKTKAIIVPHIFGFPAPIDQIIEFGIPIIEDCAQSLGGHYKGKKLGNNTIISVFSFYASKMIGAGDGGMIITDDSDIYKIIDEHKYYGHKLNHRSIEYNYHYNNLSAALARSQFRRIENFVVARKKIAEVYDFYFNQSESIFINFEQKLNSIYYRYPVRINNRDKIKASLKLQEIYTGFGVLEGLHQILKFNPKKFPNTENNLKNILSLPIYPSLTVNEAEFVAKSLIKLVNRN